MKVGSILSPVVTASPNATKLHRAAREFESMLLADLMKMADSQKENSDASTQGYDDMRTQALAQGLANQGGIGIAQMLIHQLDTGRTK